MIFSCLGALILRAFGFNRCQKGGLKNKTQKRSKKRNAGSARKTDSGLWILLRLRKGTSEDQKTRQVDQTRPDEPEGTVADFQLIIIKKQRNMLLFL
jgi:hypothetical protein